MLSDALSNSLLSGGYGSGCGITGGRLRGAKQRGIGERYPCCGLGFVSEARQGNDLGAGARLGGGGFFVRSLPVPARTLDGVVELAALAATLASAHADRPVGAFNLPVMPASGSLGNFLSQCTILPG